MFTLIKKLDKFKYSSRKILTKEQLTEQLTDYTQKIFYVTDYCTRFYRVSLPTLKKADWIDGEVIENFSKSKVISSLWLENGILNQLQWVPESIIKYDDMYKYSKEAIIADLEQIIDSPEPSKVQRTHLAKEIESLSQQVSNLSYGSESILLNLDDFSKRVAAAKDFFDDLYDKAASTEVADQEKVDELQKKLDDLNEKLNHINNSEISMMVLEGVAGAVAIYAMIEEIEWLEIAAAIFVLIVSIVSIGLDAGIANVVKEIEDAQLDMDEYTYDLTQIRTLKSSMDYLNDSVANAIQSIKDISLLWKDLENDLTSLSKKLHDEEAYIDKEEFSQMLQDIKDTQDDWDAIVKIAKQVRLLDMKQDLKAEPVKINFNNTNDIGA